jgi:type I restriction enzyme S subunit
MSAWPTVPLGEVIRHRKGAITIDDATTYKLCRVQLHRRGVLLREHRSGAAISTKKQQVCRAGDFLVAEMDAKVGGYGFVPPDLDGAIVSSHYFLFEVDAARLWPGYLEVISQAEILQRQIVAKGSTNYAAIRPASVLGWEIPLPALDVQKRIAANFARAKENLVKLDARNRPARNAVGAAQAGDFAGGD